MNQENIGIEHKLDVAYSLMTKVVHSSRLPLKQSADRLMDSIMRLKKNLFRYKADNLLKKGTEIISEVKSLYLVFLTTIDYEINDDYARKVLNIEPKIKINEPIEPIPNEEVKDHTSKKGRGGVRVGAGRKAIGVTRKVSITLPQEQWDIIDKMIDGAEIKNIAHYFRLMAMGPEEI
ncbi:hypothetical protein NST48_12600 [Paenibacillus sp. FSL M7-0547]|uniref:hypothetical protein n=1 Tax=Paenibacillus sp. FSL M7-0547 TaxID=2954755 RepID=UPI0030F8FEA1